MNFIDTHQHLILRDHFGYEWTLEDPILATGDFTPQDYAGLTTNFGVLGAIFMETGVDDVDYKAEARYVAHLVKSKTMLGQIASCRPEDSDDFDQWLDECGQLNVVGLRRILHVMPDELSQTDSFRSNIQKIGQAGLPFDICMFARQLPIAAQLIRHCDDQVFVLDHCGVPEIAAGEFDLWARGLAEVAALPQVNIKLSGIAAYCAPGTANVETLRPWVDRVLELFGPDRMVWGSDWPVVNTRSTLPDWLDMTRQLLNELSPDERSAIGEHNARRIYGV
ncbi:MAG: amidohydrolase family protein [Rhizobiaceae bacterium]